MDSESFDPINSVCKYNILMEEEVQDEGFFGEDIQPFTLGAPSEYSEKQGGASEFNFNVKSSWAPSEHGIYNLKKRDLKESTKGSSSQTIADQNKEYQEKMAKRKLQNRVAAQKSRDRRKL